MLSKTLFISDLDGTLLNSSCEISQSSINTLNSLIAKGLNFTVATARTSETVRLLTKGLDINVPAILMNGVAIYDLKSEKYLSYELLPKNSLSEFFRIIKNHGSWGFLYAVKGDALETFYVNCDTPNSYDFMQERIKKFSKKFTRVDDFSKCLDMECIYYSVSHKEEFLKPVYEKVSRLEGFSIEYYRDIYNTDFWYLEVCSETASKYNSAMKLKGELGFEKIVAFGDNLNDLPLFRASDRCYAVMNAKDEVKVKADGVIGSNNADGVAEFLKKTIN